MKTILHHFVLLSIFFSGVAANAQSPDGSLKKGDSFPPLKVKDRQGNDILLPGSNDQLLLIDFWNVNCASCGHAFLKLDSFKRIFKDSISIVAVTYNSDSQVDRYFKKLKRAVPAFPLIVNDTLLKRLFPHEGDPYYAWIKDGRVLYVSNAGSMTEENVRKVLTGMKVQMSQRLSLPSYRNEQPFLTRTMPMRKYALLLTGLEDYDLPGSRHHIRDSVSGEPVYLKVVGESRLDLLLRAYWRDIFGYEAHHFKAPNSQVFFDSSVAAFRKDISRKDADKWQRENIISLELRIDPEDGTDLYREMQDFLLRHLPFEVDLHSKDLPAILIEVADSTLFQSCHVDRNNEGKVMRRKKSTDIRNVTLNESLIRHLTGNALARSKPPYINNTGYYGPVTMYLEGDIFDIETLQTQLRKYGLKLRETIIPLPTMHIKRR